MPLKGRIGVAVIAKVERTSFYFARGREGGGDVGWTSSLERRVKQHSRLLHVCTRLEARYKRAKEHERHCAVTCDHSPFLTAKC